MKDVSTPWRVGSSTRTLIVAGLMAIVTLPAHAVLSVSTSGNANTLTNSILGSGITLVGAPSYSTTVTGASGTFSGGSSVGLGIESGLILTTGNANLAPGPNNVGNAGAWGVNLSTPDTTSLGFSFTTAGGDLFFNYVFASEEYNEWVGSQFNDHFQFLLDGVNIAIVPGTGSTPVEINTVNSGSHSAFYRNNAAGIYNNGIQYDGLTTVLTASALGLSAGTHTIELRIADRGDGQFDSAVFIQANSFSDTQTPTPDASATAALCGLALAATGWMRRRRA